MTSEKNHVSTIQQLLAPGIRTGSKDVGVEGVHYANHSIQKASFCPYIMLIILHAEGTISQCSTNDPQWREEPAGTDRGPLDPDDQVACRVPFLCPKGHRGHYLSSGHWRSLCKTALTSAEQQPEVPSTFSKVKLVTGTEYADEATASKDEQRLSRNPFLLATALVILRNWNRYMNYLPTCLFTCGARNRAKVSCMQGMQLSHILSPQSNYFCCWDIGWFNWFNPWMHQLRVSVETQWKALPKAS